MSTLVGFDRGFDVCYIQLRFPRLHFSNVPKLPRAIILLTFLGALLTAYYSLLTTYYALPGTTRTSTLGIEIERSTRWLLFPSFPACCRASHPTNSCWLGETASDGGKRLNKVALTYGSEWYVVSSVQSVVSSMY